MVYEWQSWDLNADALIVCMELALSSAFSPRPSFLTVYRGFPQEFLGTAQAPHSLFQTVFSFRLSYVHSPSHLGSHLLSQLY